MFTFWNKDKVIDFLIPNMAHFKETIHSQKAIFRFGTQKSVQFTGPGEQWQLASLDVDRRVLTRHPDFIKGGGATITLCRASGLFWPLCYNLVWPPHVTESCPGIQKLLNCAKDLNSFDASKCVTSCSARFQ